MRIRPLDALTLRFNNLAPCLILTVYEGFFVRVKESVTLFKPLAWAIQIMLNKMKSFFREEQGATAIEYALIAAGISLAITVSVFFFGQQIYTLLYEDLPSVLDF